MGHAHITDFNVAIHYSERRLHTSVAGSMAYMAPEVVGRKGYTWCVDWWSLGVVMWEVLFHRRPFDGRTAEKMTNSILKDPLKFPTNVNDICSPECQDFVRGVSSTSCRLFPLSDMFYAISCSTATQRRVLDAVHADTG